MSATRPKKKTHLGGLWAGSEEIEQEIYEVIANNGICLIQAWLILDRMAHDVHAEISNKETE